MSHHTINVHFEGRTAYVDLGDGTEFQKELAETQTEDDFMDELVTTVRNVFGDRVKSLTLDKVE